MHFRPKKIIEVGSGFSSAAMLDINEQFFSNAIDLTFVEPYPKTLNKLVRPGDRYILIDKNIQSVDITLFKTLSENDILFIDTSHIVKTNSDVLFEIFEILPLLNKGVKIHVHDIFYPFEYPKVWVVDDKRNWNEIYLIRAFLMYNADFKIISFNTFLQYQEFRSGSWQTCPYAWKVPAQVFGWKKRDSMLICFFKRLFFFHIDWRTI